MTNLNELIRGADPARYAHDPGPGSPEAERIWARVMETPRPPLPRARRPILLGAASIAVVLVVVTVVVLQIGPGPISRSVSPAAAALQRLAVAAADQPPVTLSGDQFVESEYQASVQTSWLQIGSTPTPGAQATVGATITQWADLHSVSCTYDSFSAPTFSSSASQAAWAGAGLLLSPSPASTGSCEVDASVPSQDRMGDGAVNVSGLPDDAATLARELEQGTTGIERIDHPLYVGPNVAFERAVALLVEPTVGDTPQFWSALLGAMSMIPNVTELGSETTHTGAVGLAFTAQSGPGPTDSVVVLSPSTGALLEARNVDLSSILTLYHDLHASFAPSADQSDGESAEAEILWLDPVGSPRVVANLPSGVDFGPIPSPITANLDLVAKPGTTQGQCNSLMAEVAHLASVASDGSVTGTGGEQSGNDDVCEIELSFSGSPAQLPRIEATLRANPIVASVKVFTS